MPSLDKSEILSQIPEELLPEYRVWVEVMFLGILDAAMHHGHRLGADISWSKDRAQAYWWISDDGMRDVGSFRWCCDLFNLDPERVRNGVFNRWQQIVMDQQKFTNTLAGRSK